MPDLRDESFVFLRLENSRFAQYLRDCCVGAGFRPRVSQQVVEAYSLTSLVAAGFGVALVPEGVQTLSRPGVVYRPLEGQALRADVQMAYRPDRGTVADCFIGVAREFLKPPGAEGAEWSGSSRWSRRNGSRHHMA